MEHGSIGIESCFWFTRSLPFFYNGSTYLSTDCALVGEARGNNFLDYLDGEVVCAKLLGELEVQLLEDLLSLEVFALSGIQTPRGRLLNNKLLLLSRLRSLSEMGFSFRRLLDFEVLVDWREEIRLALRGGDDFVVLEEPLPPGNYLVLRVVCLVCHFLLQMLYHYYLFVNFISIKPPP